uniref:Uncharacterized protein n=1 Tax=Arundo donax TaxID=35708 RepID=A0A0A9BA68_ARUDO
MRTQIKNIINLLLIRGHEQGNTDKI